MTLLCLVVIILQLLCLVISRNSKKIHRLIRKSPYQHNAKTYEKHMNELIGLNEKINSKMKELTENYYKHNNAHFEYLNNYIYEYDDYYNNYYEEDTASEALVAEAFAALNINLFNVLVMGVGRPRLEWLLAMQKEKVHGASKQFNDLKCRFQSLDKRFNKVITTGISGVDSMGVKSQNVKEKFEKMDIEVNWDEQYAEFIRELKKTFGKQKIDLLLFDHETFKYLNGVEGHWHVKQWIEFSELFSKNARMYVIIDGSPDGRGLGAMNAWGIHKVVQESSYDLMKDAGWVIDEMIHLLYYSKVEKGDVTPEEGTEKWVKQKKFTKLAKNRGVWMPLNAYLSPIYESTYDSGGKKCVPREFMKKYSKQNMYVLRYAAGTTVNNP